MIFKQETIKSWFSGTSSTINSEVIQPFQNASSIIDKYNLAIQHNSLTQQGWQRLLAQSDDSLKTYLTSIKGSTASIDGYNVSLQGSITGLTKVSNIIKQYNALGTVSQKEQQAFATAVGATNSKLGNYLIGLNGSTAGLRGYGVSLVTSTAKTVGLTVATTALNAAMTMGISVVVTGLISAFTAWINKSEEITEKAQEAADKINSISESLKTNTETVENAKRRYAELAQEVKNLGKITQGQGNLNNEEYEEFLDLSNQLAGIFPSLTKNYDENGNAILDLSGNVDTIVSSLDDLIQKEKEIANQQIMKEFPDVFKGYAQDVSDAEQKVKSAQAEFDKINKAYNALGKGQSIQMGFNASGYNQDTNTHMGTYISWLEDLGLTYEEMTVQGGHVVTAIGDIDVAFTSKLEEARKNLQYAQQQLEGEKSSIDSYLNTWLQGEFSYVQIDDGGLQTAIQDMLFNFDFSNIPENKRGDWNSVSEYLRRNILFEINKVQDDPVISKAISEVFSNTELTPNEKANYLQQIQDYFGEDSSIVISLKPQIDETETLQKQYGDAITKFGEKSQDTLEKFFKDNSINTTEEIDYWNEVTKGARTAEEAVRMYNEAKNQNGNKTDIFKSFNDTEIGQRLQHATKLFNEGKISYKEYFNGLQTEIENVDFSHYTDSLEDAQNAAGQLFVDTTQQTAQGLTNLINSFNSNEMSVTEYIDSYLSIAETLGTLTDELQENSEAWDKNGKALSESENMNLDGVQSDLNSAIETIKSYQDSIYGLEQILSGKLELGTDEFTAQTNVIAEDLANIVSSGGEMSEEIKNYMGNSADEIAQSLTEDVSNFDLASQAIAANTNVAIQNMATSIGELFEELGEAISNFKVDLSFGVSSITMQDVDMGILGTHQLPAVTFSLEASGDSLSSIGSAISSFGKNFSGNLGQYIEYPDFTIEPEGDDYVPGDDVLNNYNKQLEKLKDASGKAGKDAGEAYKEALEDELSDLNSVLGYISDIIEDQIDLFNDQKDAAVDALNAEKEAAEAALQAQIDLVEAQIDGIEKQIDAKKKEIDKIKEAREERQREIDLQKKQYDFLRMQNQKIGLIYKGEPGQFVYETDTQGIRDARESLEEAKENIYIAGIEKEISLLEDEISNLEDVIDSLNNQIEASNKYYEDLIKSTENYYDGLIKNLEDYQNRWKEIGEIEEQAKIQVKLKELGITTEDILNMSEDAFNSFKQQYLAILTEMYSGEQDMIQAINDVANGIDVTTLTEGLNQTKENIDNLNGADFNSVSTGLNDVSDGMGNVGTSASSASESTSSVSSDLQEMNTNAEGLDTKLSNISSALNDIPTSEKFNELTTSFTNLGTAIQSVADALGISGEDSVSGLVTALTELGSFSLSGEKGEGGIIEQFQNLKTAVDEVTSAINGGGSTGESASATNASGARTGSSMGTGNSTTGGGSGLTGAIKEIGTTTDETIGSGGEGEGTGSKDSGGEGVLGKFGQFKSAVEEVTKAIGTGEEESGEEGATSLISALQLHYEKAGETLPEVNNMFEELLAKILECVSALGELAGAMSSLGGEGFAFGTVGTGFSGGTDPKASFTTTVGKAFAKGTDRFKGLDKDTLALRSEYNQSELTMYPDGKIELTNSPNLKVLPKNTKIFNEKQTQEMLNNKGTIVGNAYADGNASVEKSSQFD